MAQLYRKAVLDRIDSPEQLDKALVVTSPMSWLALIGITVMIAAAIVWSIFGTVSETVTVKGVISAPAGAQVVVCYAPLSQADQIERGMQVHVYVDSGSGRFGDHLIARVLQIDPALAPSGLLAQDGPAVAVICAFDPGETAGSRLQTGKKGDAAPLPDGTSITARIVTEEATPISKLFPKWTKLWGDRI